ncbi:DUF2147 domain-containing protein [Helicobacter sp. 11S03491-1]|uniref:DUF2147 domain-containing protein n=1 Tax=Helicobacter sp. 11S03491-1 TaxID=1476196 RepID=UPI000BA7383E|nr:DUF2147 domain-containing protein [Helicobacter sp. 11S03491-1]PAF41039.1 hypothetical protein BKH45_08575 [Helicobacter sp. 11S03491-1]
MKKILLMVLLFDWGFPHSLCGVYQSEPFLYFKGAYIGFFKKGDKYYAYGIANTDGSPPQPDSHNPNPNLRTRQDKGVVFLYDLIQTSPNTYKYGKAYNFYNGKTYYIRIHQRENGDLDFFSGIDPSGFIGKTFLWKHVSEEELRNKHIFKPNMEDILKTLSEIEE